MSQPWVDDLAYSMRRRCVDEFLTRRMAALPAGTRLLDVGGYPGPQRGKFDAGTLPVGRVTVNIARSRRPHVLADALALPFRDASFGAALVSEVLEHVPEPGVVLEQVARVLEPRGVLVVTVPFMFPVHGDPEDHGRYTEFAWRRMLPAAGFRVEAIERQGRFFTVLADMLRAWAAHGIRGAHPWTRLKRGAVSRMARWLRARAAHWDGGDGDGGDGDGRAGHGRASDARDRDARDGDARDGDAGDAAGAKGVGAEGGGEQRAGDRGAPAELAGYTTGYGIVAVRT